MSVEVASRGCAAPPDLAFFIERRNGVATVAFARRRLQTCREAPGGWVEVAFSREALGLKPHEPVFVLNPLWSGPDRWGPSASRATQVRPVAVSPGRRARR